MIYVDKYGLYHDKPVIDGIPSSNNGWIYTAYAKALGLPVNDELIIETFSKCMTQVYPMSIERRVDRKYPDAPPISKDEIIGMRSLKVLFDADLQINHYQYHQFLNEEPKPWYKLNYFKLIPAVIALYGRHRNYVWQEGIRAAYPSAFRLLPWDKYYSQIFDGTKNNLINKALFWAHAYVTITFGTEEKSSLSAQNMLWLQMKDMKLLGTKLGKILDARREKNFELYFGKDHIFCRRLA